MPDDGHCFDCGSRDITRDGDVDRFEKQLANYRQNKDELLGIKQAFLDIGDNSLFVGSYGSKSESFQTAYSKEEHVSVN